MGGGDPKLVRDVKVFQDFRAFLGDWQVRRRPQQNRYIHDLAPSRVVLYDNRSA